MFGSQFRIFRIGGVSVEIDASWLIIFGLLTFTLAQFSFPALYEGWSDAEYWVTGAIAAILLFVAVLLHEGAHTVVAKRRGIDVPRITLFLFGGVSHMAETPRSAMGEFQIAIVGPLASLGIAVICFVAWLLAAQGAPEQLEGILGYLALINVALAVFNLLPGFPMDGGRVLRAIIWGRVSSFRRATRLAAGVGQAFGYGLIALGLFGLFFGVLTGLWFMFIGWYLSTAARNEANAVELEQILGRLLARDIMRDDYVVVEPTLPIQRVIDEHFLGRGIRAVMVAREGAVEGLLSITDLNKAPREEWPVVPAQRLMVPRDEVVTVPVDLPAVEVLETLAKHNVHQVPVLEGGRMVGLINRGDLIERLELGRAIGPDESEREGPAAVARTDRP